MAGGLALIAHRKDIDGLRAVAVVPVVLYHAGLPAISGGFVGVDVFFVISGYLITRIIRDELSAKRFTLLGFYERRARRLLPALLFMMAACFAAAWVLLPPDKFTDFAASAAATAAFSSNFWFWLFSGGYFADAANYLPLLHTWSLAVEEQFYILFPFLLVAIARFNRLVSFSIISVVAFASLLSAILAVYYWPNAAFYLAPARAWELGIGALIAIAAMPTIRVRWVREAVAGVGLLAIILAVFTYDESTPFAGLAVLAACLGAAAIIGVGTTGTSITSALLSWRPLVFCGLISYSLYLWHWPILSFLRVRVQSVELSLEQGAVAVIAAIIMATISWAFVERPFRNRAFLGRPTVFALSGAGWWRRSPHLLSSGQDQVCPAVFRRKRWQRLLPRMMGTRGAKNASAFNRPTSYVASVWRKREGPIFFFGEIRMQMRFSPEWTLPLKGRIGAASTLRGPVALH